MDAIFSMPKESREALNDRFSKIVSSWWRKFSRLVRQFAVFGGRQLPMNILGVSNGGAADGHRQSSDNHPLAGDYRRTAGQGRGCARVG